MNEIIQFSIEAKRNGYMYYMIYTVTQIRFDKI